MGSRSKGDTCGTAISNLAAFFKYDTDTGSIVEKIQLGDADPVAHAG